MTRFGLGVVGGVLAVIVLIIGILFLYHSRPVPQASNPLPVSTTTPQENPSSLSIYTNGEYGFSFFYPADGAVTDTFSSSTETQIQWRAHPVAKGALIVRIKTDQGTLSFGESTSTREKAACLTAGPAESMGTAVTVGSTTWKQLIFNKIGTDDEQQITSYRTIHNGACAAFEVSEPSLLPVASSTAYSIRTSITSFTFAQ